jgi:hypothetical protein
LSTVCPQDDNPACAATELASSARPAYDRCQVAERHRASLGLESAIAVAALVVAVAGLARTIGGFAAEVTAAAVALAVASLLAVPAGRTIAHAIRTKSFQGTDGLTLGLSIALVTTALALCGLFAYDSARIESDKATRSAIRTAILKSYAAELSWYKDPSSDKRALVEEWFVPAASGGERLAIVEAAIARLRRCHRKIGAQARTTTFVSSIDVNGSEAEAHTVQSLYQPVFDLRNGVWVPRELPPEDLSFSVPDQLYLLKKSDGRWKVQSAPQPQNLGPC